MSWHFIWKWARQKCETRIPQRVLLQESTWACMRAFLTVWEEDMRRKRLVRAVRKGINRGGTGRERGRMSIGGERCTHTHTNNTGYYRVETTRVREWGELGETIALSSFASVTNNEKIAPPPICSRYSLQGNEMNHWNIHAWKRWDRTKYEIFDNSSLRKR